MTAAGPVTPVAGGNTVRRGTSGRRLALGGAAFLLAIGLGMAPGPAAAPVLASCASPASIPDAIAKADVVLVGTVTGVDNGGRWASVRVEERWRGAGSVPDVIKVHGGPEPGVTTSIDRVFGADRYLLFLTDGPGPEYYVDNACTATTIWTDDLAQYRPGGVAAAPDVAADAPGETSAGADIVPVVALVAALLIVLIAYFVILRSRRRPPDWMR